MESEIKRVTEIAENLPKFDWIAAQNEQVGFFAFKHNPYGRGSRTNYQAINPNCIGGGGELSSGVLISEQKNTFDRSYHSLT